MHPNPFEFVLALVFLVVVVPTWLHYRHRSAQAQKLSVEDENTIEELRTLAARLEERVHTLERVLDAEAPDWRTRIS
jgi:phage shock protein B